MDKRFAEMDRQFFPTREEAQQMAGSRSGSGTTTLADSGGPTPAVLQQMGRLEQSIERAMHLFETLGGRMSGVLTPPMPVNPRDVPPAPDQRSPVASMMAMMGDRLDVLCMNIIDVTGRLEL